ncbi:hypothetical protein R3W88_018828 [Solanum pinnatisectum]|uniref:Peptidase A1 domain-containing protein n=1 Tax=Solanum pinnatisectum TaxID=50273 RepID=A0AAV9KHZ6_9SOLN|nr:hypothetical protein R3W88_018828 [Solanum pinnatisectum]
MSIDTTKLLDPPRPSYTFSIYNRDLFEKSKFKDYDSLLENRFTSSQAIANHVASILENGNVFGVNGALTRPHGAHESKRGNGKAPKTASVQFTNGEYVASFILGTEQIKSYLLVDTGSDLVWWQCGPCRPNKCYEQKNEPLYDFTKSKTYQELDCHAKSTKCLLKPKVFEYQNPVRILFGCGRDQTSGTEFSGEYSGIAGLVRKNMAGGYSLQSQFDADIMAISGLIPNSKFPTFYFINLFKIFVNDKEIPLFPLLSRNFGNGLTGGCIVDTGATVTSFPKDFYDEFRDTFRKEVRGIPLYDAPLGNFDTCYMVDPGEVPTFPIVKMYFGHQNPENLLLLEQQRVVVHERGLFCLAFTKWKYPIALIGSYQLQGIGLTFDTAIDTLSFDLDACN